MAVCTVTVCPWAGRAIEGNEKIDVRFAANSSWFGSDAKRFANGRTITLIETCLVSSAFAHFMGIVMSQSTPCPVAGIKYFFPFVSE